MAKVIVHAGDFLKATGQFNGHQLILMTEAHKILGEKFSIRDLAEVEAATEENVKKLGGTLGWGAVGGVALGPVGLLAGLLLGGKKTEVTFTAKFKDGKKLLATTDSKTFTKLRAAVF